MHRLALQFFLSSRAIYLLVWNTRLGYEHSGLDFWLSSIACHCPKAPIFIVGTHADKVRAMCYSCKNILQNIFICTWFKTNIINALKN